LRRKVKAGGGREEAAQPDQTGSSDRGFRPIADEEGEEDPLLPRGGGGEKEQRIHQRLSWAFAIDDKGKEKKTVDLSSPSASCKERKGSGGRKK